DAVLACPQGNTNGDFAGASRSFAEQQHSRVRTGDEQNHAHRAKQEVEREADIAHHYILHSHYGDALALVAVRILLFKAPSDDGHFGLSPFKSYTAFEPPNSEEVLPRAGLDRLAGNCRPEVRLARKMEARRQHGGDRRR